MVSTAGEGEREGDVGSNLGISERSIYFKGNS